LGFVDLERGNDVVGNNLSEDDSRRLVDVVVGGKDRSIDLSVLDVEGSSRSNEVQDNRGSGSRERSTGDAHISSSSKVNDPSSVRVALRERDPGVLAHLGLSQRENVLKRAGIVASNVKSTPLDDRLDVIGESGHRVLISSVARLSSIELSVEASSGSAVSSNESSQVRRSREGSSNEDVFFSSSVRVVRSIGISSSRRPGKISSDDHIIRKSLISGDGMNLISNGPSSSKGGRSSNSKSSFNISSIGRESSERNNIEVQPGVRISVKSDAKSRASSFPRSGDISRAVNAGSIALFSGIARSDGCSADSGGR